jgi:hypothetical protein
MTPKLDTDFYREKSWGAIPIRDAWDLPSLKIRYVMELLRRRSRADASLLELWQRSDSRQHPCP